MKHELGSILRNKGLSVTAQRLEILTTVANHPHITADRATEIVTQNIGTISRQSVYDSLNTFAEKGIIRRIQPIGSPALHEVRVDDNHHHLICRDCGVIVDVDCSVGMQPCLEASDNNGFEIDEAEIVYWGTCPACQKSTSQKITTSQNNKEEIQTQ